MEPPRSPPPRNHHRPKPPQLPKNHRGLGQNTITWNETIVDLYHRKHSQTHPYHQKHNTTIQNIRAEQMKNKSLKTLRQKHENNH